MRCYDCAIHYSFFFHIAIKTVENKFSLFVKYKHVLPLCYQSIYPSSLSSRRRHIVAAVTSWCHLHCHVVTVSSLPLRCRLHRHIVAVSLSQSHCCGAFAVALSRFCHRRHGVTFIIALSRFCRRRCGVAFMSVAVLSSPSRCCLHCRIVTASSGSQCCLHRHIVAVSSSQFRHRHCGVAFVVALLWCRRRSRIVVVPLVSHRCSFIVTVAMLPSSSHCCGVCCHFIITIVVSPSSLHCHSVVVAVLLSLLQCCFRCRIVITLWCHRCSHVVAWSWSWSWSWSHHGRGHHGHGCGCVVVVAVIVASLWSLLLHCGRCC